MTNVITLEAARAMYAPLGYEILSELTTKGGFKQVFLANYKDIKVAFKVLHVPKDRDFARLEIRVPREATIMASLDSPYIAKLIDYNFGGLNHEAYLAEEYIEGSSLAEHLKKARLNKQQLFQLIDEIFQALTVCAKHRIVHRDLKPDNIMLRPNGTAVLTDFGLARPLDDSTITVTGMVIGTIPYAAPEFLGYTTGTMDETSDLFSLGIIIYEIITGRHPFIPTKGYGAEEQIRLMREAVALPPHEIDNSIPLDFSQFVMRLLRRDRGERYQLKRAYEKFKQIASTGQ